jgi:hypothetical protein
MKKLCVVLAVMAMVVGALPVMADSYCDAGTGGGWCCKCFGPPPKVCTPCFAYPCIVSCVQQELGCDPIDTQGCFPFFCDPETMSCG